MVEPNERLKEMIGAPIVVTIQGDHDEDQGLPVEKHLYKIAECPDHTHMRIYFDSFNFVAFPIDSSMEWFGDTFQAYDSQSNLYYRIRKGKGK
ncbi:hypothetical protein ACTWQL_17805 [Pseudalkalibacillus sp. R45]|uniref:hypothetical protein n=1 Tax=Pseudalkalibacillus sp. R45 TaxID=3457433 RepID=UPI003FCEC394